MSHSMYTVMSYSRWSFAILDTVTSGVSNAVSDVVVSLVLLVE